MEQFIGQQVFAQVVGAQEMYQVTVDLIARIIANDQAVIDIHMGNNIDEQN